VVAAVTLLGNGVCGTVDNAPHYYIKSCSQHIFTVQLYEEYHHHNHHIPPPSTVTKLSVCSVHNRSDCLPLNSRLPNSTLSVPPPQKCVLMTGYVEARKINTDCSCRHWKQTDWFILL